MDYSAAETARRLHTSIPRVKRAVRGLGLDVREASGGRLTISEEQLARLRRALGDVPSVGGLTRPQTQALAALARAPLGLVSIPALAQRAGLSVTGASHAVRQLERAGLVERRRETIAAGHARHARVLHVKRSSQRYRALARELATVTLPTVAPSPAPRRGVPGRLHHLFWNAEPNDLDTEAHGVYIAQRLLSSGDLGGLAWGAEHLAPEAWQQAATVRGLAARDRALAGNLAATGLGRGPA